MCLFCNASEKLRLNVGKLDFWTILLIWNLSPLYLEEQVIHKTKSSLKSINNPTLVHHNIKTVRFQAFFYQLFKNSEGECHVIISFFKVIKMTDIFVKKYISWIWQIKAQYEQWRQCFDLHKVRQIELNQGLGNALIFSELVELNIFCWQILKGLDTGSKV